MSLPDASLSLFDRSLPRASSALALGTLELLYTIQLLNYLGIGGKGRDLTIYLVGGLCLAPLCALSLTVIKNVASRNRAIGIASFHIWLGTVVLTALAAVSLFGAISGIRVIGWTSIIPLAAATHVAAVLYICCLSEKISSAPAPQVGLIASRCFAVSLLAAVVVLFRADFDSQSAPFILFVSKLPFDTAGAVRFSSALIAAFSIVFAVWTLFEIERRLIMRRFKRLALLRLCAVCFAIIVAPIAFFDYSLPAEALHYLTNISPAMQLRHGGVLMVDTFSQYGPGPVLAILLGLAVLPDTLSSAALVVESCNFSFFAVWLVCLFRLATYRLPALLLGTCFFALLLALWGVGSSNIHFAPSILGLRYITLILMVLAISCLRPAKYFSIWTGATTFIAALWSIEALAGTLAIQFGFVGLIMLRNRAWRDLPRIVITTLCPVIPAALAMSFYTIVSAGEFPHLATYLGYLSTYNFGSDVWAIPANGQFFGWASLLAAVFLTLTDAWRRIFDPNEEILSASDRLLFYQLVPMALLCFLMASYYVGRSVDYTVVLALLPFAGLIVPAVLWLLAVNRERPRWDASVLLGMSATIFAFGLAFAIVALSRPGGPYRFALHECRDYGRCSPGALVEIVQSRLRQRAVLERVGNSFGDSYFDQTTTTRDALSIIGQLNPSQDRVTVLLGSVMEKPIVGEVRDQVVGDVVLFYAGKWHRWPRSDTFVDELLPARTAQILASSIDLADGELVLVRSGDTPLGKIEAGILDKLRSQVILCKLPQSTDAVLAYRVSKQTPCVPGPT